LVTEGSAVGKMLVEKLYFLFSTVGLDYDDENVQNLLCALLQKHNTTSLTVDWKIRHFIQSFKFIWVQKKIQNKTIERSNYESNVNIIKEKATVK